MCTALSLTTHDHYFGRTLDIDCTYGEQIVVMPRSFPLVFRHVEGMEKHYAMMGMAVVTAGMPLFYDAVNEHGLAIAGLNFPGNAVYTSYEAGKDNIAQFELIPRILGQCKATSEARSLLERLRLVNTRFNGEMPSAPLHWMISDKEGDLVVEVTRDGMHIYENPVGVLTNNPPFPYQLAALRQYRDLRNDNACVAQEDNSSYSAYSQGLGAVGLPGDVSSMSRFARLAFARRHSLCERDEVSSVGQFFHLLSSVEMVRGVCVTDRGGIDITAYTACMNCTQGRYYYTTYENRRISCVDMRHVDLGGDHIALFSLAKGESIQYQN